MYLETSITKCDIYKLNSLNNKEIFNGIRGLIMSNIKDLDIVPNINQPNDIVELYVDKHIQTSDICIVAYRESPTKPIGISLLQLDRLISGFEDLSENLLVRTTLVDKDCRNRGIGQLLYSNIEDLNNTVLKRPYTIRGTCKTNNVQRYIYSKMGYTLLLSDDKRELYGKRLADEYKMVAVV